MDQATTLDQQGIRHLGIYRKVTKLEALIDKRILRSLYSRGYYEGCGEGYLANYCRLDGMNDPVFKASIARLVEWAMVEVVPARYKGDQRVCLLPTGKMWAEELVSAVQLKTDTE